MSFLSSILNSYKINKNEVNSNIQSPITNTDKFYSNNLRNKNTTNNNYLNIYNYIKLENNKSSSLLDNNVNSKEFYYEDSMTNLNNSKKDTILSNIECLNSKTLINNYNDYITFNNNKKASYTKKNTIKSTSPNNIISSNQRRFLIDNNYYRNKFYKKANFITKEQSYKVNVLSNNILNNKVYKSKSQINFKANIKKDAIFYFRKPKLYLSKSNNNFNKISKLSDTSKTPLYTNCNSIDSNNFIKDYKVEALGSSENNLFLQKNIKENKSFLKSYKIQKIQNNVNKNNYINSNDNSDEILNAFRLSKDKFISKFKINYVKFYFKYVNIKKFTSESEIKKLNNEIENKRFLKYKYDLNYWFIKNKNYNLIKLYENLLNKRIAFDNICRYIFHSIKNKFWFNRIVLINNNFIIDRSSGKFI